jgi:tetratricopeptide (TPR) repeat protein
MEKDKDILIDGMDERIESFLCGTMNADEEAAFKQEIKSNPELRSRAMEMTALIKGFKEHESIIRQKIMLDSLAENANRACAERVKRNDNDTEREINDTKQIKVDNKRKKNSSFLWWAGSAAAICIIFFSIFKAQRYRTLDETISPYNAQYDIYDISRGDVDSVTVAHLYSLFKQIQTQHNVTNVIKELEPIYASLDSDYTYHPYANDIAWNLALAYVKDDQIDKAIPVLEKLKEDNPDTPIYLKADELLKKLKEL